MERRHKAAFLPREGGIYLKKAMAFIFAMLFVLVAIPSTAIAGDSVPIYIGDEKQPILGALVGGTAYVPLRGLFEKAWGCTVTWDGKAAAASVSGDVTAYAASNAKKITVNGRTYTSKNPNLLLNGTMMVPLRLTAEAAGARVKWNSQGGFAQILLGAAAARYDDELYWLARVINAESGGEPYNGKLAVGAVVLNRVKSRDFPNTIYGVIFDTDSGTQFNCISYGYIYGKPNAESVKAAKSCLEGNNILPSALYFFNPATATLQGWIVANRPFITQLANHAFYG